LFLAVVPEVVPAVAFFDQEHVMRVPARRSVSSANSHASLPRPAAREKHDVEPRDAIALVQRMWCVPLSFEQKILDMFELSIGRRIRLKKGETLFGSGEKFVNLYAIRVGSCKTVLLAEDGRDQVSGYHMVGDVLGTDGIGSGQHDCQAIALEDMEMCVLPFDGVAALAHEHPRVLQNLHRLLAREISRERQVMLMLGTMRADQRLSAFLLDLAARYHERGYSATEFVLRMTRDEIGSYLGLKLETISRLLSRMHRDGLIQVQGRVIKLLNSAELRRVVDTDQ
jgi:CRP/FNR family transcriptional regulator